MTSTLTFAAVMEIIGVNPYVLVSVEQATLLKPDWRRPMPVLVQINGHPSEPWRINMMPRGDGTFYLYLHEAIRKASGTGVGDTVTIRVAFDDSYSNGPQHPLPDWFMSALAASQAAQSNWDALPPSKQKELLRYFAGLKSDEAKQRNLRRAMDVLNGNDGHFLGRDWMNGS